MRSFGNTGSETQFELQEPSVDIAASYERMRDAVLQTGHNAWTAPGDAIVRTDVRAYVEAVNRWAKGMGVPEGWVPSSTYWIVQDGEVVGDIHIRHRLTEHLRDIGGHIGYLTHPDHRNKGVATFALQEGLKILATMGVSEAVVTCLDDNLASIRVIEKCGGQRIQDSSKGPRRRRYVFALLSADKREPLVRERSEADIPSCIDLLRLVHDADDYPTRWPDDVAGWLAPRGFLEAWIGIYDNCIVGHVAVALIAAPAQPFIDAAQGQDVNGFAEVARLFIHPSSRRIGVGRLLLARAVEAVTLLGLMPAIEVNQTRGAAMRLYERTGWQTVGSGPADWIDRNGKRPTLQYFVLRQEPK